ncbi:MAG TPA: type III secretion system chaperone [Planctomycetaceae bacterium]|nr:type III secretion system chaperone [Planctomycetaceae bacterium]
MTSWNRRTVLGAAVAAVAAPVLLSAQDKPAATAPAAKGRLTDESLGSLLKAMGLEAKLNEKRYDFEFKSTVADADWVLSMSAVLSQDASSVWIMAWLDELPKSAADVPRTALLRLLSENDKMGRGKFFAYIASNRRFVLQRVIPNENMTTAAFRAALDDLGATVVHTHAFWSVQNWSATTSPAEEPAKPGVAVKGSAPVSAPVVTGPSTAPKALPGSRVPQQAINDPKTQGVIRK